MVSVQQYVLGLQVHVNHLCASAENDKQVVRQMTFCEHASKCTCLVDLQDMCTLTCRYILPGWHVNVLALWQYLGQEESLFGTI